MTTEDELGFGEKFEKHLLGLSSKQLVSLLDHAVGNLYGLGYKEEAEEVIEEAERMKNTRRKKK